MCLFKRMASPTGVYMFFQTETVWMKSDILPIISQKPQ